MAPRIDGSAAGDVPLFGGFEPEEHDPRVPSERAPVPRRDDPFFGTSFVDFENVNGVHLSGSILWCDTIRKNGLSFLSSALAGDIAKNRRVLCTEATARLATRGKGKLDVLVAPYAQSLDVGDLRLSLHPAGHLLGSAQLRIERGGRTLVYAADVCTRPSGTTVRAEPVACDVLAIAATHGGRAFQVPDREEVLEQIRTFVDGALETKRPPVLLVPPLGIGQELIVSLGHMGYPIRAHKQVADVAKIYGELGVLMPPIKRFGKRISKGEVGIFPSILRSRIEQLVPEARIGFVGPRALDPAFVHQLGVQAAFPISNIADRAELLELVEKTGAREVFLTGGYVESFGADLRDRGYRVHDLLPRRQLELF